MTFKMCLTLHTQRGILGWGWGGWDTKCLHIFLRGGFYLTRNQRNCQEENERELCAKPCVLRARHFQVSIPLL